MCSASVKLFMGAKDDIKPCPGPVGWALAHAAGGLKPTLRIHGGAGERKPRPRRVENGLLGAGDVLPHPPDEFFPGAVLAALIRDGDLPHPHLARPRPPGDSAPPPDGSARTRWSAAGGIRSRRPARAR